MEAASVAVTTMLRYMRDSVRVSRPPVEKLCKSRMNDGLASVCACDDVCAQASWRPAPSGGIKGAAVSVSQAKPKQASITNWFGGKQKEQRT